MKTVRNFVKSGKSLFGGAVRSFLPPDSVISFSDATYQCRVGEGMSVAEGQVIATAAEGAGHSDIHSPLPGRITSVVPCRYADGSMGKTVTVHLAGSFSYLGRALEPARWQSLSGDYLLSVFEQKGVENTFYRSCSLATQIRAARKRPHKFLVVRMFDEDPSRMTDSFVAARLTPTVLEGAAITARALDADGIVFAMPKKPQFAIDFARLGDIPFFEVHCDTDRYPAGFEQDLVEQVVRASQQENSFLFARAQGNSVLIDPETAVSVHDAVVLGIPVVERYVQVSGKSLDASAMFRVRIGTTIRSLAEQCGGTPDGGSIIVNGLLSGRVADSADSPVGKDVKSVLFQARRMDGNATPCIRCGKCRSVCPQGIYPDVMYRHCMGTKLAAKDLVQSALLCSDCGLCNSVCPSRLPLCQTIELLRNQTANGGVR